MGELSEDRWSVISERGREASGLRYADAARLVGELKQQKVYGTCVVTDETACRLAGDVPASAADPPATTTTPAEKRAARRKK